MVRLFTIISALFLLLQTVAAQRVTKEFPLTRERELVIIVDVSFGTLQLERGPRPMAAIVEYDTEWEARERLAVTYDVSGSRGKLRVKSRKSSDVFEKEDPAGERRTVLLRCTEDIPITFELELGAGTGDIDLTGLQVQEFRISTGASKVRLWCNQPNPISADRVDIESGVSKFTAENLSNLNFRKLKFDGGVGTYALDFGGRLLQNCEVDIDLGLGAITIDIPRETDARLRYDDNWFSSFRLAGDFKPKRDGYYETVGFGSSRYSITIGIDSGLGSVRVRRR